VAILMVSVRSDFLDKVEAIHSGADGYFEKPVDWDALLRRLQHLLDRQRLQAARILCVEDFGEQAAFLRSVLQAAGYEIDVCADPRRFDEHLTAFRPDLVVMDVLLPGISGYDLTRYLRQHPRFAAVPILFLTTDAHPEARIEGFRAGGDDFLVKPVAPALLLSAVAAHLERARLLRSLMERDGLTRLLTHTAFLERLKDAYERARRRPELQPALVMMDLDRFKLVNDRFGHATGDRVLVHFASLLRRRLRHSDVVGRYGGEEFSILLEGLDANDTERLVVRLRQEFGSSEHRALDGSPFQVTLSAGIAFLDVPTMTLEAWKQAADEALYRAKSMGRDRVVIAGSGDAA
jgi:diguanylate cyclase (GGDEF)-like protein